MHFEIKVSKLARLVCDLAWRDQSERAIICTEFVQDEFNIDETKPIILCVSSTPPKHKHFFKCKKVSPAAISTEGKRYLIHMAASDEIAFIPTNGIFYVWIEQEY